MIEQIVLGLIQGIAEWLPVSSEGMIVLAKIRIFNSPADLESIVREALWLHLGTLLSAVVYFRRDIGALLGTMFHYRQASGDDQKIFRFLLISTAVSGALGIFLIKILTMFSRQFLAGSSYVTILVGLCLIGTGILELRSRSAGYRRISDLKNADSILLGFIQGLAALPGFSRSGLTVSVLLLRKFDKTCAIKLSFLMSIPIVLAGNILLNFNHITWSVEQFAGVFTAFLAGLLTIHALLWLARKINFGYFVLIFAVLVLISAFI